MEWQVDDLDERDGVEDEEKDAPSGSPSSAFPVTLGPIVTLKIVLKFHGHLFSVRLVALIQPATVALKLVELRQALSRSLPFIRPSVCRF